MANLKSTPAPIGEHSTLWSNGPIVDLVAMEISEYSIYSSPPGLEPHQLDDQLQVICWAILFVFLFNDIVRLLQ